MEFIDKIMYINLDNRTDRKEESLREFKKMGIPLEKVIRCDAIKRTPGLIGCGLSHIKALEIAKDNQFKNTLILEDDFYFLVSSEELNYQLNYLFNEFKEPWDVIMFGYNFIDIGLGNYIKPFDNEIIGKVGFSQNGVGYLVKDYYYDCLIQNFEEAMYHAEIEPSKHWVYSIDVYWKKIQKRDNWYYFKQRTVSQRSSYSDICETFVDNSLVT